MYDLGLQALRDTGGTGLVLSGERSEGQVFPQVYAEQMSPGRGRFVRRGERARVIQVAHFLPTVVANPAPGEPGNGDAS